ncbi:MAG: glycosyltransferase family 2 protein [Gammaproteobacteria bacterium]
MLITREDKLFMFGVGAFVLFMLLGNHIVQVTEPLAYLLYLFSIPFLFLYYRIERIRAVFHWIMIVGALGGFFLFDISAADFPFLPGVHSRNSIAIMYMLLVLVLCLGIALSVRHRLVSNIAITAFLSMSVVFIVFRDSVFRELLFPAGLLLGVTWLFFSYREANGERSYVIPAGFCSALLGFYLLSEVFPVFSWLVGESISSGAGILATFMEANPLFGEHSEILYQWQNLGLFGMLGTGLFLGIPVYNMYWAVNHPDKAMRFQGVAGILFVLAAGLLSLFGPVLSNVYTGAIYAFGVMLFWAELRAREDAWLAESKQRMETISVGVICMNEADRIGECLSSVAGWADEIVVFDSGSIDETVTEARKFTDKVFETDWPGYGMQKRRVVEKCTGDWVLSIDADEIVTQRLKNEIDGVLNGDARYDGFKFFWSSEVFGGKVDFGADGRRHLRLFRRSSTAEFSLDVVHEGVVSAARVRALHGIVIHKTFRNYAHLLEKFMSYAMLQSTARYEWGRRANVYEAALRGIFSFLSLYIYRLGFLDGWRGFLMAGLYSQYTFNKYAALWVNSLQETENCNDRQRPAAPVSSNRS